MSAFPIPLLLSLIPRFIPLEDVICGELRGSVLTLGTLWSGVLIGAKVSLNARAISLFTSFDRLPSQGNQLLKFYFTEGL